jgi:hypothetical protein
VYAARSAKIEAGNIPNNCICSYLTCNVVTLYAASIGHTAARSTPTFLIIIFEPFSQFCYSGPKFLPTSCLKCKFTLLNVCRQCTALLKFMVYEHWTSVEELMGLFDICFILESGNLALMPCKALVLHS